MPANLPPEYFKVEASLRQAKTPREKIEICERLLAIIPKHKGTEKLLALYKTKIAKLRDEMQRRPSTAKRGLAFHIEKSGAGQIIVIGPPNGGRSMLIRTLTRAVVEVGDYPFTTRSPAPFMMKFENIKIQLIDMPPIVPDDMEFWIPEMIKAADAVLCVLDMGDPDSPFEMENIFLKLREKKVELVPEGFTAPAERQAIFKKNLVVASQMDKDEAAANLESLKILDSGGQEIFPVSALTEEGIDRLKKRIFDLLDVVRVYSKIPGKKADFDSPFILKNGSSVMDLARAVHKDFSEKLNFARVWSRGGGLEGLRVNRDYVLRDEDVAELHI